MDNQGFRDNHVASVNEESEVIMADENVPETVDLNSDYWALASCIDSGCKKEDLDLAATAFSNAGLPLFDLLRWLAKFGPKAAKVLPLIMEMIAMIQAGNIPGVIAIVKKIVELLKPS